MMYGVLADYSTLFDSMAAMINPSMHSEFKFPYRPNILVPQKPESDSESWHTAALIHPSVP